MALRAPPHNPSKPLRPNNPLVSSFRPPSRIPMARQTRSLPSVAASLHHDAAHRDEVLRAARSSLGNCLSETHLELTVPGLTSKARGKVCSSLRCFVIYAVGELGRFLQVRDVYDGGDYLVLVTTDRQSAFDRVLASIPFKGQVFPASFDLFPCI